MVVLGGAAVSYERGTTVHTRVALRVQNQFEAWNLLFFFITLKPRVE